MLSSRVARFEWCLHSSGMERYSCRLNIVVRNFSLIVGLMWVQPLSLEEILKKRKEDALQQAKVVSPLHFLKCYHLARSILVDCVYLERNYLVYMSEVFVRQHLLCT